MKPMFRPSSSLRSALACAFCLVLLLLAPGAHAAIIGTGVGPDGASNFTIDETTGAATVLGPPIGVGGSSSMAKTAGGVIYTVNSNSGSPVLSTVDPTTGVVTPGPAVSISIPGDTFAIYSLAFSPGGTLYAAGYSTTAQHQLYTIDLVSGAGTLIGPTTGSALHGLDFSPSGVLYGWDITGKGLVIIDPATAAVTDVDPAVGDNNEISTLAFSDAGQLYGGHNNLYTIDLATGAATLVGPITLGGGGAPTIWGMAFTAAAPAAPGITVAPAGLNFGNVGIGATSAPLSFTVSNPGSATLNFSWSLSGDPGFTPHGAGTTCAATLAAGASCQIAYVFSPVAAGPQNTVLGITSDAPAANLVMRPLSGTGVALPPGRSEPTPVPVLDQAALILLAACLAALGVRTSRRRSR